MTACILSVKGLQAGYGHAQVLFDISFDVKAGEVITLLGRNGMGRSTTIKCLFGMLPMTGGQYLLDGQSASGLASHKIARKGLAIVPEGRQIFTTLTVEENLIATAWSGATHARSGQWSLARIYEF